MGCAVQLSLHFPGLLYLAEAMWLFAADGMSAYVMCIILEDIIKFLIGHTLTLLAFMEVVEGHVVDASNKKWKRNP